MERTVSERLAGRAETTVTPVVEGPDTTEDQSYAEMDDAEPTVTPVEEPPGDDLDPDDADETPEQEDAKPYVEETQEEEAYPEEKEDMDQDREEMEEFEPGDEDDDVKESEEEPDEEKDPKRQKDLLSVFESEEAVDIEMDALLEGLDDVNVDQLAADSLAIAAQLRGELPENGAGGLSQ